MISFDCLKLKPRHEGMTKILRSNAKDNVSKLGPNEIALYELLLEGYTLKQSMRKLSLKYLSAKKLMKDIYNKLGVKSQAELIINYREISVGSLTNNKL